jgi:hypothetical protein
LFEVFTPHFVNLIEVVHVADIDIYATDVVHGTACVLDCGLDIFAHLSGIHQSGQSRRFQFPPTNFKHVICNQDAVASANLIAQPISNGIFVKGSCRRSAAALHLEHCAGDVSRGRRGEVHSRKRHLFSPPEPCERDAEFAGALLPAAKACGDAAMRPGAIALTRILYGAK